MKKIIFIFAALVMGIQAFGQVTDIKYLATKTPQEIVNMYDNSRIITDQWEYDVQLAVENDDFVVGYDISENGSPSIHFFSFTSSLFCVFSDYIDGGIKIGDNLSRLQLIDFVNTPYGRGRQENALSQLNGNWLQAYSYENAGFFFFKILDGYISEIYYKVKEDCNPNDINPYSPFGN
jgi:hypothetical protein